MSDDTQPPPPPPKPIPLHPELQWDQTHLQALQHLFAQIKRTCADDVDTHYLLDNCTFAEFHRHILDHTDLGTTPTADHDHDDTDDYETGFILSRRT
jgi:hypothetical protein